MNFDFSEEQHQLRDSLRALLTDRYTFEWRRASIGTPTGLSPDAWGWFAELGILSMTLPERVGGLQLDRMSTLVVMEELGRSLVIEPYLETVVMCGDLLARAASNYADQLLAKIGSGTALVALAASEPTSRYEPSCLCTSAERDGAHWQLNGVKSMVISAPWASHLLVPARTSGGVSLFMLDKTTPGVVLHECATIDGRRAADIVLRKVQLPAEALLYEDGLALERLEHTIDAGIAALGAEAIGVLEQLHHLTLDYCKQRRQFGQPIGKFQALQHRLVDMYMEIELARSAIYLATLKLDAPAHERAAAAAAAKASVNQACRLVGQSAVQLHGGIGMTDDVAVSHLFKRASTIELQLGTTDYHVTRYAALKTQSQDLPWT